MFSSNKSKLILRRPSVMTITDISEIQEIKLNKASRTPAILVIFKSVFHAFILFMQIA